MRPFFQSLCAAITIGILLCATGCAIGSGELDRAAEGAGKLVTFYCENVSIPEIREQFRAAVNQHAAPHSVSVQCAQGGQPLIATPPNATPAPLPNSTGAHMSTGNPHEIARVKARDAAVALALTVASLNGEVPTVITEEQLRVMQHDLANAIQARDILEKECTLLNERIRERDTELSAARSECAALAAEVERLRHYVPTSET